MTGPPAFVGVGAQKSGTTWWSAALRDHPEISIATKELHFFDSMETLDPRDCPVDAYHAHFAGEPLLAGEFTPRYMFDPWVPALLRVAAPEARLIMILRDPVDRYRSGIAHVRSRGVYT